MNNALKRIIKIAKILDESGYYDEADSLTYIATRLSNRDKETRYAQTAADVTESWIDPYMPQNNQGRNNKYPYHPSQGYYNPNTMYNNYGYMPQLMNPYYNQYYGSMYQQQYPQYYQQVMQNPYYQQMVGAQYPFMTPLMGDPRKPAFAQPPYIANPYAQYPNKWGKQNVVRQWTDGKNNWEGNNWDEGLNAIQSGVQLSQTLQQQKIRKQQERAKAINDAAWRRKHGLGY